MFPLRFFLLFICLFSFFTAQAQLIVKSGKYADSYIAGTVHFRLKGEFRNLAGINSIDHPAITKAFQELSALSLKKRFPEIKQPEISTNQRGERLADLSLIYTLKFPENKDIEQVISTLIKTGIVDHAEPHFIQEPTYVPSDDSVSQMYAHYRINSFAAWDVHKGDTNMVIGITDTGYDPFHPDIIGNIKHNYADPVNGLDDDNDGYTDNFSGWDIADGDNDPTAVANFHGQHVSGLAAATTDNGIGVAGTGFRCKFIHVKIANGNGSLTAAYEGLIYAVEHGCKVINCSWGGFQYSEFNAEIIRYASINKDCIVFCGAGNSNNDRLFYPASYEFGFSVAATNDQDFKADFSSFGYMIDACAPGDMVVSTWIGETYMRTGGTSMSAPITAGVAAVMRSAFPSWSSQQIAEQLKRTTDPIDQIPFNSPWQNKLGTGRINFFRALTETGRPSVLLNNIVCTDGNENLYLPGDTLELRGIFINYLYAAQSVNVQVNIFGNALQTLETERNIGSLASLQTLDISANPFLFRIAQDAGYNETSIIEFVITADGLIQRQYYYVTVNADFINIKNTIWTSVGSAGMIGVSGNGFLKGLGFQYNGNKDLLYQGGLMIGNTQVVLDNVRGENGDDQDLSTFDALKRVPPLVSSTQQFRGTFGTYEPAHPIYITQRVLADTLGPNRNFAIVEYSIENISSFTYSGVYAGIYTDWDLADPGSNNAGYASAQKTGYVFTVPQDTLYTGIRVLGNSPAVFHAIDNVGGGAGGLDLSNGFDGAEKYTSLSVPRLSTTAGAAGTDVICVTAAGPFEIAPGEKTTVAFALLAGSSYAALIQNAGAAGVFYQSVGVPLSVSSLSKKKHLIFPNPASGKITIQGSFEKEPEAISLSDLSGRIIRTGVQTGESTEFNVSGIAAGLYYLHVHNKSGKITYPIMLEQ